MGLFKFSFILLCAALLCALSYKKVTHIYNSSAKQTVDEVLYLPNGKGLQFISFGYRNVLSHTLWFNTINYFGKHFKGDRNYTYLNHMCNLVTDLNPKMIYVYDFCGLMLAWEANLIPESIALLDKAVAIFPNDWKFLYLRGMTKLVFQKDTEAATADFLLASKLPNVHPIVIRLTAKKLTQTNSTESAIEFLEEMIKNSAQESERTALTGKLEQLQAEKRVSDELAAEKERLIAEQQRQEAALQAQSQSEIITGPKTPE